MDQNQPNRMYITDDEAQRLIALLGEDADANRTSNSARAQDARGLMNEINNRYVGLVGNPTDSPERTAQLKVEADHRAASLQPKPAPSPNPVDRTGDRPAMRDQRGALVGSK